MGDKKIDFLEGLTILESIIESTVHLTDVGERCAGPSGRVHLYFIIETNVHRTEVCDPLSGPSGTDVGL